MGSVTVGTLVVFASRSRSKDLYFFMAVCDRQSESMSRATVDIQVFVIVFYKLKLAVGYVGSGHTASIQIWFSSFTHDDGDIAASSTNSQVSGALSR